MNTLSNSVIVAIASEDGKQMPNGHFGKAPRYELYEMRADRATWLRSVDNPRLAEQPASPVEHALHVQGQGVTHKGGGIGQLLRKQGVQVMVSRAFGANIKRMRQRFLPVLVRSASVSEAIDTLQADWQRVEAGWQQGEARKHLVLR